LRVIANSAAANAAARQPWSERLRIMPLASHEHAPDKRGVLS
jgi:hypothetical protein